MKTIQFNFKVKFWQTKKQVNSTDRLISNDKRYIKDVM